MRTLIAALSALAISALSGPAFGQASLQPDPRPRVPPQPGQGLPLEDVEFLRTAAAMSRLQGDYAQLAREKANDPKLKQLATQIGGDNQKILSELSALSKARKVDLRGADTAVSNESAVTNPRHATGGQEARNLAELRGMSGGQFDRAFIDAQLSAQDKLADLYQTQSSQTPDRELATFAITTLVKIQDHRRLLREAARDYGIAVDVEGQPPQYGKLPE